MVKEERSRTGKGNKPNKGVISDSFHLTLQGHSEFKLCLKIVLSGKEGSDHSKRIKIPRSVQSPSESAGY